MPSLGENEVAGHVDYAKRFIDQHRMNAVHIDAANVKRKQDVFGILDARASNGVRVRSIGHMRQHAFGAGNFGLRRNEAAQRHELLVALDVLFRAVELEGRESTARRVVLKNGAVLIGRGSHREREREQPRPNPKSPRAGPLHIQVP